jgi:hypothetical protein
MKKIATIESRRTTRRLASPSPSPNVPAKSQLWTTTTPIAAIPRTPSESGNWGCPGGAADAGSGAG